MKRRMVFILIAWVCIAQLPVFALTAEEIIGKIDDIQTFSTSVSSGEISAKDRFGVKSSTFKAWTRGTSDSLIEFTSLAEKGQKVLRTKNELYLFYPDAQELIRLQGAALRQSMLGTDISYEDMTGEKDTLAQYTAVLAGQETLGTHTCHVVVLTAKTRSVAYPMQKLWIDTQSYVVWKSQYSTQSGRLLKELEVLETQEISGRLLSRKTKISDKTRKDTETTLTITSLEIDIALDPRIFSLENLTW